MSSDPIGHVLQEGHDPATCRRCLSRPHPVKAKRRRFVWLVEVEGGVAAFGSSKRALAYGCSRHHLPDPIVAPWSNGKNGWWVRDPDPDRDSEGDIMVWRVEVR